MTQEHPATYAICLKSIFLLITSGSTGPKTSIHEHNNCFPSENGSKILQIQTTMNNIIEEKIIANFCVETS